MCGCVNKIFVKMAKLPSVQLTTLLILHFLLHVSTFIDKTNAAITVINPEDLPKTSSYGVFYEVEDGQLLYETTAPVIYTVRLPNWLHFLVLPEKVQNCSEPSSCAIYRAFHEIANEIRSSLQGTPHTFPSVTEESTWGLRCNYISKHFSSSFITPAIVQKYMGFLRACSDGLILEEPLISDFTELPNVRLFQQLEQAWASEFFSKFNESAFPEKVLLGAVETGEVESILSLGVTSFVTEAIRWNMALSKCGTGHIPDTIINPERFYESVQKLNATVDAAGYRFVIPPKETFLPVYFKSEFLTDCSISLPPGGEHGNDMDLIVRILVPVIKKDADWKHLSVKSFQFVTNKTNITVFQEFPLNIQQENSQFIYDNSSNLLFTSDSKLCDVTRPGFCRVPQIWDSRRVVRSNCLLELISGQFHVNNSKCIEKMEVAGTEFPGLPFIVKEGTHTFYVTGIRDESTSYDISIACMNSTSSSEIKETYYYEFPEEGALKIRLPCECQLQVTKFNNAIIRPELGCSSILDVSVVLPV